MEIFFLSILTARSPGRMRTIEGWEISRPSRSWNSSSRSAAMRRNSLEYPSLRYCSSSSSRNGQDWTALATVWRRDPNATSSLPWTLFMAAMFPSLDAFCSCLASFIKSLAEATVAAAAFSVSLKACSKLSIPTPNNYPASHKRTPSCTHFVDAEARVQTFVSNLKDPWSRKCVLTVAAEALSTPATSRPRGDEPPGQAACPASPTPTPAAWRVPDRRRRRWSGLRSGQVSVSPGTPGSPFRCR